MYSTHRLTRIGPKGEARPTPWFALGTSGDGGGEGEGSMNPLIDLAESEFVDIDLAAAAIDGLNDQFTFRLVELNYADLVSNHRFVTLTLGLGRRFTSVDRLRYGEAVMAATMNWLGATRTFLDHTETDLKNRFGNESAQVSRFKKVTGHAYDTTVGYRFVYKFRNYVQHCGRPASHLSGHADGDRQVVKIELDRDQLLAGSYDFGATVRSDIEAMDDRFDLMPLAAEAMEGLRAVHHELMLINLEHAADTAQVVVEAINRLTAVSSDGWPTLFMIAGDGGETLDLSYRRLNNEGANALAATAADGRSLEDLIRPRGGPEPALVPERVAGQLHAETRGAQVMAAYYSLHDTDPAGFVGTLHELIDADGGDAGPTINGLIGLCSVLGAIAGLSMGRSVQSLIADLVEQYANPEVSNGASA